MDSIINLKLESTTCFTDAWILNERVGPAPTVLPWESNMKPCSILKYSAMFSSIALASGVSPVQSIPTRTTESINHLDPWYQSTQPRNKENLIKIHSRKIKASNF